MLSHQITTQRPCLCKLLGHEGHCCSGCMILLSISIVQDFHTIHCEAPGSHRVSPQHLVLAERVVVSTPFFLLLRQLRLSFLRQILPYSLSLLQAQRKVAFIEDTVLQFLRQLVEHANLFDLLDPPVALLRRDVGCGRDMTLSLRRNFSMM